MAEDLPGPVTTDPHRGAGNLPDKFYTGRILEAVDSGAYFKRHVAETYINRETLAPTKLGHRLIKTDPRFLLPGEKLVLQELIKFLRLEHGSNPQAFARFMGISQKQAAMMFLYADQENPLTAAEQAATGIDQEAIAAAREAGLVATVQSLYDLGNTARKRVADLLPTATMAESIRVMSASLQLADKLEQKLMVGGKRNDQDMDSGELVESLRELLDLAHRANVTDFIDVTPKAEIPQ